METGVLTLIDVLRIQGFVFASNRLKDIAAGSMLVSEATDASTLSITAASHAGELVFAAGGNALLAFPSMACAKDFAGELSRGILEKSPGLDVEVAHEVFGSGEWASSFLAAQKELERRKLARKGHAPMLGLSVTAECDETRRVAEQVGRESGRWHAWAATTAARRAAVPRIATQWERWLPQPFAGRTLKFPDDNDKLGRDSGHVSLVGLVHVDGNGVGRRVSEWIRHQMDAGLDNEAFQKAQRKLAEEINATADGAMKAVVDQLVHTTAPQTSRTGERQYVLHSNRTGGDLVLAEDGATIWLPIRPILVGGDDITFLCDGRLALTLARTALEYFANVPVESFGDTISACAGVAIVKSHAPFARAYTLAEELCHSAKSAIRRDTSHARFPAACSAIDWHVGHMTTLEPLEAMREREYRIGGLALHMRPYPLTGSSHSFEWLDDEVLGGGQSGFLGSDWQRHRNKIKALREIVRHGPKSVEAALKAWVVTAGDDVRELPGNLGEGGFVGQASTPLLDAIELADLHLPLD